MKNCAVRNRLDKIRVPEKAAESLVNMLFQMISSERRVAPISPRPLPDWIRRHPYCCVVKASFPDFSDPEQGNKESAEAPASTIKTRRKKGA